MKVVPRDKYPEMDWRAADKVDTWKLFKCHMKVIFVADQVPEERQYALILVAGGDKAYNCWDTLEDMVEDPKKPDQVWDTFEKSFEQSTSFWHFRDAYLANYRQDPTEHKVLEYKDHQASHTGANSMPSYNNLLLTAHAIAKRRPVAGMHAISVANLMSEATAPHMGRPVINVRVLIISKPFVIPRLRQPRQHPALTGARSHSHRRDVHLLGATVAMAKEVEGITRRRRCQRSHQSRKHTRLHSRTWSYQK